MTVEAMEYLKALLNANENSPEWEIGWALWMTPRRDDQLQFLTETMTHHVVGSRGFEVARELTWLLGVTGAAA